MDRTLIVIDGLDGSGKATQTALLKDALKAAGKSVRTVSFPDYSDASSALVRMYLGGEFGPDASDVNAYAASSFYAVDRYASYKRFWEQDYLNGTVILADRYVSSNAIHQMVKLHEAQWDGFLSWMEDYEYEKLALPRPAAVIYLDMHPDVSRRLLAGRYDGDESKKDLHERDFQYLLSCRRAALYTADRQGWKVIRCDDGKEPFSVEAIHQVIFETIKEMIE